MKKRITEYIQSVIHFLKGGLDKARTNGIPKKILIALAILSASLASTFMLIKMLEIFFDTLYSFIDRHFFSVAAATSLGSYLIYRRNEKLREQTKIDRISKADKASQQNRFVKGCYGQVAQFIYVNICTSPNFTDLTSCARPYRPEEMGNNTLDAYTIEGIMYLRYALPKITTETLDCSMVSSVLQGLINQRIKTGGLQPFISAGENRYLYVDKVEDMQTYMSLQLILNFDEKYIQQMAFQNAMNNVLERENASRQLEDNDYHG